MVPKLPGLILVMFLMQGWSITSSVLIIFAFIESRSEVFLRWFFACLYAVLKNLDLTASFAKALSCHYITVI